GLGGPDRRVEARILGRYCCRARRSAAGHRRGQECFICDEGWGGVQEVGLRPHLSLENGHLTASPRDSAPFRRVRDLARTIAGSTTPHARSLAALVRARGYGMTPSRGWSGLLMP